METAKRSCKRVRFSSPSNYMECNLQKEALGSEKRNPNLTAELPEAVESPRREKQKRIMRRSVRAHCSSILEKLRKHRFRGSSSGLGAPLRSRVSQLMDFETVRSNLDAGEYRTAEEFADDVLLTLDHALRYTRISQQPSYICKTVRILRDEFDSEWRRFRETNRKRSADRALDLVEKVRVKETGSDSATLKDHRSGWFKKTGEEVVSTQPEPEVRGRGDIVGRPCGEGKSASSTGARICISEEERRSICLDWRRLMTERQREAARKKIESMTCTSRFQDNLDAMREFDNLLGIRSTWIARM